VGHDLANFGVDGGTVGYRLCANHHRKAGSGEKHSQSARTLFRVLMAAVLSEPDPDRVIFPRKYTLGLVSVRHQGGESSARAFASMREIDGLKK